MTTNQLDEMRLNLRIKLISLWAAVMFFYLYGDYFALYIPGEAENLVKGKVILNNPVKLFVASVLMAVPPTVILITAMGRAFLAKWANVVAGILFTGIMVLIAATSIDIEWAAYVFYAFVESCTTIAIVWLALKWPKNAA